jgi:glutathione-specific gamma-glutamylcyclotransferase
VWIFGYGSLMGDGWEKKLGCFRRCVAVLQGYRRTFNKASTTNRGTQEFPCPTLNLEKDETAVCKGVAFEFPHNREDEVREYLLGREGKAFPLESLTIRLDDDAEVRAYVPVYCGKNLVPATTAEVKAIMVRKAVGTKSSCRDYVKDIAELLGGLGIDDPVVSELWQAVRKESLNSLMDEIRGRLELLESNLPRRVDGFAVSQHTKIPFKTLIYRAALMWRMAELSRSAMEHFESSKLTSAIQLTRAAFETSAALWYLRGKLDAAVESQTIGDIGAFLMRLLMGSRNNPDLPQPINVMTFVEHVEKDIKGFRQQYDGLSEFAHPNWAGTSLLYSRPDSVNGWTDFGANIRASDNIRQIGVLNLSVALGMVERSYSHIGDVMPSFVALCEKQWDTSDAGI